MPPKKSKSLPKVDEKDKKSQTEVKKPEKQKKIEVPSKTVST
jgi:hypothetical protein